MIARGSLAEVQSALYIASDQGYIRDTDLESLYSIAAETGKMITQLSKYLRNN